MTDNTQPEVLDLSFWLEAVGGGPSAKRCAALLREQHARIAELESELAAVGAGGVQALSAAPAGWKLVPVNPTPEMWKAAKSVPDPNPPYPPHYGLVWDAMLAASPTPTAEQQAEPGAVYAELPAPTASIGTDDAWHEAAMRDFADRTHTLRASHGQAPAGAAQADSVQEDAARYRFIRDVPYSDDVRSVLVHQQNAAMDRVIDAARKQGATP